MLRRGLSLIVGLFLLGASSATVTGQETLRGQAYETIAPSHLPPEVAYPTPVDMTPQEPQGRFVAKRLRYGVAPWETAGVARGQDKRERGTIVQTAHHEVAESSMPNVQRPTPRAEPAATEPLKLDRPGWPKAGGEAASFGGDFLRLLTWTMVILGVGIGGILFLKRTGLGGRFTAGTPDNMRLHGTLMIAPRMGVHLISVSSREFLIAVDQRGISAIAPVPSDFPTTDDSDDVSGEAVTEAWAARNV